MVKIKEKIRLNKKEPFISLLYGRLFPLKTHVISKLGKYFNKAKP